jgi:hypothetical protein
LAQHHHAVFVALAAAHNDRVAVEIHILDPQTQRFAQAQPTPVEQGRQQCLGTRHVGKQRMNLLHRQHHWNPLALRRSTNLLHPRQLDAQYLPIQEQQGIKRLPMGCGRNLLLGRQHRQKAFDLSLPHVARMPKSADAACSPQNKRFGPVDISLLGL